MKFMPWVLSLVKSKFLFNQLLVSSTFPMALLLRHAHLLLSLHPSSSSPHMVPLLPSPSILRSRDIASRLLSSPLEGCSLEVEGGVLFLKLQTFSVGRSLVSISRHLFDDPYACAPKSWQCLCRLS